MKGDIKDLKDRVKNIELTQETVIIPRLNTIESCYISTYERYRSSVEDYDNIKQDISVLKGIVAEHSKKLMLIS